MVRWLNNVANDFGGAQLAWPSERKHGLRHQLGCRQRWIDQLELERLIPRALVLIKRATRNVYAHSAVPRLVSENPPW